MPLTKVSTHSVSETSDRLILLCTVNVLKGTKTWNDDSEFDAAKNKAQFRQYGDACDRVKSFYKEQHGTSIIPYIIFYLLMSSNREADHGLQHQSSGQV